MWEKEVELNENNLQTFLMSIKDFRNLYWMFEIESSQAY